MAWGSLLGFAALLTLAVFVLRILWGWLVILLVLGPPAYVGIVAGYLAGTLCRDVGVGLLVAVLVAGALREVMIAGVRRVLRPSLTGTLVSAPYWRASGIVCTIRRSAFGLHIVLKGSCVKINGHAHDDLCFAPCLCIDRDLSRRLERSLKVWDLARLEGRIEPCTRTLHPLIAHERDLIVTKANVPLLANRLRRSWRSKREPVAHRMLNRLGS